MSVISAIALLVVTGTFYLLLHRFWLADSGPDSRLPPDQFPLVAEAFDATCARFGLDSTAVRLSLQNADLKRRRSASLPASLSISWAYPLSLFQAWFNRELLRRGLSPSRGVYNRESLSLVLEYGPDASPLFRVRVNADTNIRPLPSSLALVITGCEQLSAPDLEKLSESRVAFIPVLRMEYPEFILLLDRLKTKAVEIIISLAPTERLTDNSLKRAYFERTSGQSAEGLAVLLDDYPSIKGVTASSLGNFPEGEAAAIIRELELRRCYLWSGSVAPTGSESMTGLADSVSSIPLVSPDESFKVPYSGPRWLEDKLFYLAQRVVNRGSGIVQIVAAPEVPVALLRLPRKLWALNVGMVSISQVLSQEETNDTLETIG